MNEFEEIELLLRKICFKVKVVGRYVLKDFELTPSQFDILHNLYFEGPKRMSDLSEKTGVTKSTMTGLISRMESLDYIKRVQSARDRRVTLVQITSQGERIIQKVIEKRIDFIRRSTENKTDHMAMLKNLREVYQAVLEEFVQLDRS